MLAWKNYNVWICIGYRHTVSCYTAKNQYRKFKTNIPRKGIVPISTFMWLWAIYIFPRSICLFCCRKYVYRSWEYINRSQTHECGNWDWGRTIPRKGIYKLDFLCSVRNSQWRYMTLEFYGNSPGCDSSILRHSGIWGTADEAVLNNVRKKNKAKNPLASIAKRHPKVLQL